MSANTPKPVASLNIELHSASDLPSFDGKKPDSHMKVTVYDINPLKSAKTEWTTSTKEQNNNPKWNEHKTFPIYNIPCWFVVEGWTTGSTGESTYIGQCKVECTQNKDVSVDNLWLPLVHKRSGATESEVRELALSVRPSLPSITSQSGGGAHAGPLSPTSQSPNASHGPPPPSYAPPPPNASHGPPPPSYAPPPLTQAPASPQHARPLASSGHVAPASATSGSPQLTKSRISISYQVKFEGVVDEVAKKKKEKTKLLSTLGKKKKEKALIEFVEENDADGVEEFLSANSAKEINKLDARGFAALHIACMDCQKLDYKILDELLGTKGIDVNVRNNSDNTPLHYLCANWKLPTDFQVFDKFFALGADVNASNASKETPLFKAITNNTLRKPILKKLLGQGADPNSLNSHGEGVLHYAARLGRVDLVKLLLKYCDSVEVKGNEGKTPLEVAKAEANSSNNNEQLKNDLLEIVKVLESVQALYAFLNSIKLDEYKKYFIDNELFLDDLLDMSEEELGKLDIKVGPYHKLVAGLKDMKKDSHPNHPGGGGGVCLPGSKKLMDDMNSDGIIELKKELEKLNDIKFVGESELEFCDELGRGASGTVWKGFLRTQKAQVPCAVKVLHGINSSEDKEEFKKEVRVLNMVSHPCVMKLFGVGLHPLCMIMEFCSRGSLMHVLLDEKIVFEWDLFFSITKQIVEGLRALHHFKPQILHRDLKTLNIMMTENFGVRVADFGLSLTTSASSNALRGIQGTAAYMAPELIEGDKYTAKCDIYSFGVLLWELVYRVMTGTGTKPYAEYKDLSGPMIIMQASGGLRPTIPETSPAKLAQLISNCWHQDGNARPTIDAIHHTITNTQSEYEQNAPVWRGYIGAKHTETKKNTFVKKYAHKKLVSDTS